MSLAPALGARRHANYVAFLIHRLSGLALALFLPLHFWALGTAIEGEARLEAFLRWSDAPLVKAAEFGLVVLLAVHLGGGLRILALEFLPWHDRQKTVVAASVALALAVGLVFLLNLA
jgi:fumarate reductase subunit D